MDLPELLAPERIRCHCDCKSKKRTLQTIAEVLGASLRANTQQNAADTQDSSTIDASKNGGNSLTHKILKSRERNECEPEILTDMDILDALIGRERLGSTGLGHGVGLPHSRVASVEQPIAAFVSLRSGVDYESLDEKPVDLVLGLLVPENCNDDHLKILAHLAKRFNDPQLREKLRSFSNPHEMYHYLSSLPPID